MTVPATARRAGPFNGNGVTTSFPFAFKVFAAGDIEVVLADEDGLETVLVLGSGYSVTLNADQDASPGGSVTYPLTGAPLPALRTLTIRGAIPYDQTLDLPSGGAFSPRAIENALDRSTFQIQQLAEELGRSLTLPLSAAGADTVLPVPVAGNVIGWDDSGEGLRNVDPATLASIVAYATWRTDLFDGGEASYTLERDPGNASNCDVVVGGVPQTPGVDFTVSGTTLTPTTVWPVGTDNVVVRYGQALPQGTQDSAVVTHTASGANAVPTSVEAVLDREVHIEDYAGPSATDYATALARAITALGSQGGTVLAGPKVYPFGAEIQVPPYVNIVGAGLGATVFRSESATARFNFIRGSFDGRGGRSGSFMLNANNICPDPLVIGVCVEREFSDIEVWNAAAGASGVTLNGTQNCQFFSFHSQNNAGANITLDLGAGNNRFVGCEFSQAGTWNVRFLQTGVSPSGGFTDGPTSNRFIGCILERAGWAAGAPASPDTASGVVYHAAGRFNSFSEMDIELGGLTSTNKPMILIEKAYGSYSSLLLNFHNVNWSGSAGRTTAMEARANTSIHLSGRHSFENHDTVFRLADTARVYGSFFTTVGGVTSYFQNQGGGTQPQQNLILNEIRARQSFLIPSGFVAQSFIAEGASFAGTETYAGLHRYGDGASAANIQAGFAEMYGIDGFAVTNTLGGTAFVMRSGPIDIEVRNTIPSAATPDGSIGVNTAGAPGLTHYMRSGGVYHAIPHQIQGTWTANVRFGGLSTGITYTSRPATFTRIGDRVFFDADVLLSSKGSATGVMDIVGLPFVSAGNSPVDVWITAVATSIGDTSLHGLVAATSSGVRLDRMSSGFVIQLTDADMTNTSRIVVSGSYRV